MCFSIAVIFGGSSSWFRLSGFVGGEWTDLRRNLCGHLSCVWQEAVFTSPQPPIFESVSLAVLAVICDFRSKSLHIVACEKMAQDLKRLYPVVTEVRIISGIAALDLWDGVVRHRDQIRSIGFLSNISIEKGILEFLEVAAWADQAKLPIRFLLAGPYQDGDVRSLVEERVAALSNVNWIGAVYGRDKQAFFDSIDIFLFPTKYANESEGLVIHEAMSRGVPVIAYSRGCIEQIVSEQVGLRLAPAEDYVAGAVDKINEWRLNPQAFQLASQASLSRFNEAKLLHTKKMDALCAELVGRK